ncbi:MAG: hypothetical protein IKK66_09505 [Ruminococcus sp.]|nr:hypothetical protein [Ruminococcus sp.]
MKITYRDRIIIGVLLAIALLLAGFFLLIKPQIDDRKSNMKKLSEVQSSQAEVDKKIAEIDGIKDDINESYDKGIGFTETFVDYNSFNNTRKLDQYMQNFAEESEVKIMNLAVESMNESSLDYYYFTPTIVGEEALKKADINGSQQQLLKKDKAESDSLSERTAEDVVQAEYKITVEAEEKENIWKYMELLEQQEETILINSVQLKNIEIKEREDVVVEESEEEKLPTATFIVTLYSVFEMDEPYLEME